ncbi:hypothetical protein ACS126_15240 [Sphingobacterium lactis]|uniref:hypothetical protein n=1 Tax=Sphingobacterium lactis TaxID=797291 RepID=UPI003EC8419E
MKTKAILTAILLLFGLISLAQKMEYKTIQDLEDGEKVSDIYIIDLKAKTLKVRFEDGVNIEYKIDTYTKKENQEDEDVYGEDRGVKFTEHLIELEDKKVTPDQLLRTIAYIKLMVPENQYAAKFRKILHVRYHGLSSFYYSVTEN